ncbi:MAG: hypothetical protein HC904_10225 [Blastochloris sp.]|nr:hypothetical protein [Blastochloris sp.]
MTNNGSVLTGRGFAVLIGGETVNRWTDAAENGLWSDINNWSLGEVPLDTTDVIIGDEFEIPPIEIDVAAMTRNFFSAQPLDIQGGNSLTISGNFGRVENVLSVLEGSVSMGAAAAQTLQVETLNLGFDDGGEPSPFVTSGNIFAASTDRLQVINLFGKTGLWGLERPKSSNSFSWKVDLAVKL